MKAWGQIVRGRSILEAAGDVRELGIYVRTKPKYAAKQHRWRHIAIAEMMSAAGKAFGGS